MEELRTPLTAASRYRAWRSSVSPGRFLRVTTGVQFRARMATPFQERSPSQTASYPSFRRAFSGKAPDSALSSCKLTTSGLALASQPRRLSNLLLMLLMLKVATFTRSPFCCDSLAYRQAESVPVVGVGKPLSHSQTDPTVNLLLPTDRSTVYIESPI